MIKKKRLEANSALWLGFIGAKRALQNRNVSIWQWLLTSRSMLGRGWLVLGCKAILKPQKITTYSL